MQLLQSYTHRDKTLALGQIVMQNQAYIDQTANSLNPEIETELRAIGLDPDTIIMEINGPIHNEVAVSPDTQELPSGTPFSAIIDDGDTSPGHKYFAKSDDGTSHLVTIKRVYATLEMRHMTHHVEGTVQSLD